MGIRETLNRNPAIAVAAAAVVLVGAGIYMFMFVREEAAPRYGTISFYSDDDGASYFEASNKLIPPFDHRGKQAYLAHVYSCDDGKTTWVGYLEGWRPEAKPKLERLRAMEQELMKNPNPSVTRDKDPMYLMPPLVRVGMMVKKPDKPGQPPNKWVTEAEDGSTFFRVQSLACPHGDPNHTVSVVLP